MTRLAKAASASKLDRSLIAAIALAMALSLWLLNATGASGAAKFYDSTIGTTQASSSSFPPSPSGTAFGGFFSTSNGGVGDVAINDSSFDDGNGADGFIYVVDRGNNRVQAFDAAGAFQFAIGRDVIAPSVNEAQLLTVDATAGKFKLEFDGASTADLDWNISATNLDNALDALVGGIDGNVIVTGTPATATVPGRYTIQFAGTFAAANQDPITVLPGAPALTGSAQITTQADGSATPGAGDTSEIQTVTVGGGSAGGDFTLSFGASGTTTTDPILFGADASTVDTELEKLTAIGAGGVSVSGDPGGPYTVQFTGTKASIDQAQVTANPGGLTPSGTVTVTTTQDGASFEKCTVSGQCKVGTTTTVANSALGNAGTFNIVQGIDVNQETGDFFVRERNSNSRVQQFSATGEFIRAFGWDVVQSGPGNDTTPPLNEFETCNAAAGDVCKAGVTAQNFGTGNPGQFGSYTGNPATGIAVAPTGALNEGEIYVADPGSCRVQRFEIPASPSSAVSPGTPFGSPPPSPSFPIADHEFCSRSTTGVGADSPQQVAAAVDGVIYAGGGSTTGSASRFTRFDTTADSFLRPVATGGGSNQLGDAGGGVTGLEVDPVTGLLLLVRAAATGVTELDFSEQPEQVGPEHVVERHITTLGAAPKALGAGGNRFFVATSTAVNGSGSGERLLVLDEDGIQPSPIVSIAPPDPVGSTTATFRGNIDPVLDSGFETFYRWQLQRVAKEGGFLGDSEFIDVTASVRVPPNGFTKSDVTHNATGLDPNTLYRLRIRTDRNPAAGFSFSANQLFLTEPMAPVATTRAAQQVTDVSGQILGNLHPGGLATTYWFEWGEGGLDRKIPVPSGQAGGGHERAVGEALTGLESDTAYSFRLCAQNSLVGSPVCGVTRTFATRSVAASPAEGRSYEMVLSPDKPLRRGGERAGDSTRADYGHLEGTRPSIYGGAFRNSLFAGATSPDAGAGHTTAFTHELHRRQPGGVWTHESIFNVPLPTSGANSDWNFKSESADLSLSVWETFPSPFPEPSPSASSIRKMGDTGGPRGKGWYPWLNDAWWYRADGSSYISPSTPNPVIDDEGERLVWQSVTSSQRHLRGVTPADGGPAPEIAVNPGHPILDPPQTAGRTVWLSNAGYDWRPGDLVNECSGAGVTATLLPSRVDAGTVSGPPGSFNLPGFLVTAGSRVAQWAGTGSDDISAVKVGHFVFGSGIQPNTTVTAIGPQVAPADPVLAAGQFAISAPATALSFGLTGGQNTANAADDTLGTRPCEAGSPTDVRGAIVGGLGGDRLGESTVSALSEDGNRIFFLTPDPNVGTGQNVCEVATGLDVEAGTRCPAQLFVRQYDDDGDPTVRWLSRPEDAVFYENGDPEDEPAMHPDAALGNGVAFEGASRDGDVVYFRTNAVLLENDENGGLPQDQTASPVSWDLYRYELGSDNDADPAAGDPGSHLTRVSGGLGGTADPNTNCTSSAADCGGAANGADNALRFISDDGSKAYFVTVDTIPGAANAPPAGSSATNVSTDASSGSPVNATRNLYLYDHDKDGSAAYEFIASLPAVNPADGCATRFGLQSGPSRRIQSIQGGAGGVLGLRNSGSCVHGSSVGDAIIFETPAQLTVDDTDADIDVYVYDAAEDRLTRVSAPSFDSSAYRCLDEAGSSWSCNGDLGIGTDRGIGFGGGTQNYTGPHWNVAQNAEGELESVYFESRLPLVATDQNGPDANGFGGMDVYEWRRANGRLSLVSPGSPGGDSAFYSGNSLDGRDVFFWTEERISPWELDEADGDVYNATTRTDLKGDPPTPPPACDVLAGACQPPAPVIPAANGTASAAIQGQGNFVPRRARTKPRRCARGKVRRGGKCVAKKKAKPKKKNKKAKRHSRANADRRAS